MKTVAEIYQSVADNINAAISEGWRSAELHIEVIGQMVSNTGSYVNSTGAKKQIDVDAFDFQLTFDLLELHQITTEGGSNQWNRSVFTITAEGKFDIKFIWDQKLQYEVE